MNFEVKERFQSQSSHFSGLLYFDEPLSKHTYYRIGGPAEIFAVPRTLADLDWLSELIEKTGIRLFVMGQGSNLLVSDAGFKGLVVRVHRLNLEITPVASIRGLSVFPVRTGGSVALSTFLRRAAQEGWGGLEFLSGIPGSVGGAIAMNAGTYLGETQSRLEKVEIYSFINQNVKPKISIFMGEQLQFQYRKNLFFPPAALVWSAEWRITAENPLKVKTTVDEILGRRKATQPIDYPSCGSVFKNPKDSGLLAWQVIDRLGLRGYRIGDAQFAEKHSNFILNLGGLRHLMSLH